MSRLWPFSLSPFSSIPASPLLPAPIPLPTTKEAKDEIATLTVLNTLLEPFKGQDIPLKARSDPTLLQKAEAPMTVAKIWQYVPFLASQGSYTLSQYYGDCLGDDGGRLSHNRSRTEMATNSLSLGQPFHHSKPFYNSADRTVRRLQELPSPKPL